MLFDRRARIALILSKEARIRCFYFCVLYGLRSPTTQIYAIRQYILQISKLELLRKVICYVPTLRFPDFSEEWRSTPMKIVCSFAKGYGIAKENLSTEGTPCILYGELYTTYKTAIAKDIRSKTQLDPTDLFHSKANDVIIPCSGETAIDIATSVCVPYDDVLLGGDLTVIRTKLNGAFLSNQLNGVRRKKIATIAQGASIVHLHADELKKINITYPTREEQDKIAHFIDCLDERIATQNKIISKYESLIKGIRERIAKEKWNWIKLDSLIQKGVITLNRGNIIPKHIKDDECIYPVYSSSTQNSGLMGYSNGFMFDKVLITWSIDGGGNFFYRYKHKFNVTNVCGILQVDESVYSYRFIAEMLIYQHSKMKFDYQSKAHPSVISSLYSLPEISLAEQEKLGVLFEVLTKKMQGEILFLDKLKEQKKYLLSKMFI